MANSTDLLSKLHDIHAAPPVAWWPLAPGWWIVVTLVGVVAVLVFLLRRRAAWRTHALRELQRMEQQLNVDGDASACIARVSALLRRTALSARAPTAGVAGLTGEAWLKFLDEAGRTQQFTNGPGRSLAEAPYTRANHGAAPELIQLAREWVRAVQ